MTFADEQIIHTEKDISFEYIRGLIDGEGCFTFCPGWRKKDGKKSKVPAFVLSMHERDQRLIEMVRNKLELKNKVYNYKSTMNDGYKRGRRSTLMVREFDQLKDIIIPLFYKKLHGYKNRQFIQWLEKIGSDPDVNDRFKSLYRLYAWGIYDNNPKFVNKFIEEI